MGVSQGYYTEAKSLIIDRSEEIQWMDFETRMRKVIKELLSPVLDRAQEDRELLLKINQRRKTQEDKVAILENSVFKTKNSTSMFDDIEN